MKLSLQYIERIKGWMLEAGQLALKRHESIKTEIKADETPVTDVELSIEHLFIDNIHDIFPRDSILAEESGLSSGNSSAFWTIDPIDGTKSYILGLPTWGISLSVYDQGAFIAGFFYMPVTKDLFWG